MSKSAAQPLARAIEHHRAGRLAEAEAIYRRILSGDPRQPDALNLLGLLAHQVGNHQAAIELGQRAIAIRGDNPGYHNNLGLALRASGRSGEAAECFRTAVTLKPDFAEAYSNLGNALQDRDRLDDAVASYRRALALNPDLAEVHANLGNTLLKQSRIDEALASCRQALALQPERAEFHNNLGNALRQAGKVTEAIAAFQRALVLAPNLAQAYFNLGLAYGDSGRLDDAVACYRRAIAVQPDYADALCNLGGVLGQRDGGLDEAIACYRRAIAIRPDYAEAYCNLGIALGRQGRLEEALDGEREAVRLNPDLAQAHSNLLMMSLYASDAGREDIGAAHRAFAARFEAPLQALWRPHPNSRDPERRLKIGYVSPDFHAHSVAFFIEPILARRDHNGFELYAYHTNIRQDAVTERIRGLVDHWCACAGWSGVRLAERIRGDGIDVLVDLAGHSGMNSVLTFARKPAPVQVTYLGYPTTTGLAAMDYRLTTLDIDPDGSERGHSEHLYRLPRTLWCYRSPNGGSAATGAPPAARNGFVTFGSMNNVIKLSPQTLAAWARILEATPESRLCLTGVPQGSGREWLQQRLASFGIAPERVILHGRLPAERFYALADEIDIALDPFPYNGTTTTCEALWMGIPVVSVVGATSVSRCGYALLKSVGLEELCGRDEAGYVRIATGLAGDLNRLATLRHCMRPRLEASPLRDEAGLARDIEEAYRAMWRKWCRS